MPVQNSEIAKMFYTAADLLEIEGANPFRVRAYREAARTIENHPNRVHEMVDAGQSLEELSGIGEDLAAKIKEIVETGHLTFLEKLRSRTPVTLLKLLEIPGLGPKRVQTLYNELEIASIQDLKEAIASGKVERLDGFGPKTVENIQETLQSDSFQEKRTRIDIAEQFVDPLINFLKGIQNVQNVAIAGSYRRRKATVGDLDIVVVSEKGKAVSEAFGDYDSVKEILSQGETKTSVKLRSGLQVDVRIVSPESFGAAMLYFTGSKAHNIHLRNLAVDKGLKINEYGVFEDKERILGETEKEIYQHSGLSYIEPELREDTGEIEAARENRLPDLVKLSDIRGDLQMHTDHSDGEHNLSDMAEMADNLGYEYIAITDHTSYVGVTQGLKDEDVAEYLDEIDAFNEEHDGVTLLKGVEVDIHKDGTLDLSNTSLEKMDIVLGAVHSHLDLSENQQTERIIRAMDNPYFNILAHPTTRRINDRKPININLEKVMEAALEHGCFLEINASPERLDLWDRYIKLAGDLGLKLSIGTDSHRKSSLLDMKYGLYQARRGWAEISQILNTYPLDKLKKYMDRA